MTGNILDTLGNTFYTTLVSHHLLVIHYRQNTYNTLLIKSSIQSHYMCNITGNENLYENYVMTQYCSSFWSLESFFQQSSIHRYLSLLIGMPSATGSF
jgi:hypothetical protein